VSKFKVGDTVRLVREPYGGCPVGHVGVVRESCPSAFSGIDMLKVTGMTVAAFSDRFELVPPEPKFKVGDKVKFLGSSLYIRRGDVFEVEQVKMVGTMEFVYPAGQAGRNYFSHEFELVTEPEPAKPEVPTLPGVPEGYRAVRYGLVNPGEYYAINPFHVEKWDGMGLSNASYLIIEPIAPVDPPKPKTRTVKLVEYLVWDEEGEEYILEISFDPMKDGQKRSAWTRAHPTGKTRDIEVPCE